MARQLRDAQCHTIWEGTENICVLDVRRAMRSSASHEAVLARIDRALAKAESATGADARRLLGRTIEVVRRSRDETAEASRYVLGATEDLSLLQLRRLAYLMADTLEAALVVEEAATQLAGTGNARKAVVARRVAGRRLSRDVLSVITSGDRTVIDLFEPMVRYGEIEPGEALAAHG